MNDIRIGVIGARRGGFMARVCGRIGGAAVTAFYDIDEAQAAKAAAGSPACRAFGAGQWAAFLDSGLDAAFVASPVLFHVPQAVECLGRGLHVISEVPAAATLSEAKALVAAVRAARGTYMLAENCAFLDEVELFRRLRTAGELGEVYQADAGYLHDCRSLWLNPDGTRTWRGRGELGVYCTHSLGPILYVLDDRVASVSCLAHPAALFDRDHPGLDNYNMLMRTAGDRTIAVRVDSMGPRPYACYYRLQGTRGTVEFTFGQDTEPRGSLAGDHRWHGLEERKQALIPERLAVPEEIRKIGHGGMEYWMVKAWLSAVREGRPVPIDVHAGLDCTLPGIVGRLSAQRGGEAMPVPDSRTWT